MGTQDYQGLEHFILDESFREYVEKTSASSVTYWKNWISLHPEMQNEIREATLILTMLLNKKKAIVPIDKHESLHELINRIEARPKSLLKISVWMKVAAILIITIGIGWFWNSNMLHDKKPVVFNEVIVPIGEKSQVVLGDGTHVWINSGSTFKYPASFNKKPREVYLSGEAFFDVTHQKNQTFVVNTHDARIKVLGTAFNVKAYPEDKKTQTTVVRGLVSIQSLQSNEKEILVHPSQMAVIQKNVPKAGPSPSENLKPLQLLNDVNIEAVTCWKNHSLIFADETLEDMAVKMGRWFDMEVIIQDNSLKKERYNGKFVHNETIYEVLEAIRHTTSIKYKAKDNKIYITRK